MAKIPKKVADEIRQDVSERCRIQRPSLLEFFLTGEFEKLPAVKRNVIKTPYLRNKALRQGELQGWEIPAEDLGAGSNESIRLWIKQNLGPLGPCGDVIKFDTVSLVDNVIYRTTV